MAKIVIFYAFLNRNRTITNHLVSGQEVNILGSNDFLELPSFSYMTITA